MRATCEFVERDGYCECVRDGCGRRIANDLDSCRQYHAHCKVQKIYFGDLVANILHRIGIKPTGNCNCDSRRKWLNQFDRKVRSLFR